MVCTSLGAVWRMRRTPPSLGSAAAAAVPLLLIVSYVIWRTRRLSPTPLWTLPVFESIDIKTVFGVERSDAVWIRDETWERAPSSVLDYAYVWFCLSSLWHVQAAMTFDMNAQPRVHAAFMHTWLMLFRSIPLFVMLYRRSFFIFSSVFLFTSFVSLLSYFLSPSSSRSLSLSLPTVKPFQGPSVLKHQKLSCQMQRGSEEERSGSCLLPNKRTKASTVDTFMCTHSLISGLAHGHMCCWHTIHPYVTVNMLVNMSAHTDACSANIRLNKKICLCHTEQKQKHVYNG